MSIIYMIIYDISEDKKRTRAAKLLIKWGYERIQYSAFTGLQNPYEQKQLWAKLSLLIDAKQYPGDKIFSFAISKKSFKEMKLLGHFGADVDYLLGDKLVEIIG